MWLPGGAIDEKSEVQLSGDQLKRARELHRAAIASLTELSGLVFEALEKLRKITLFLPPAGDMEEQSCIEIGEGEDCSRYCDPPGTCGPCVVVNH